MWQLREMQLVEEGEERGMRLLRARRKGNLCSAMQGLWLGDREVRSRVVGDDRSRLPGRGTFGEARRGGRRVNDRTKEKIRRFSVKFRKRENNISPAMPQPWR